MLQYRIKIYLQNILIHERHNQFLLIVFAVDFTLITST
ncbi:hypothetical protein GM3709_3248 [Geminocystis sp. NIES-3709]|nr:hypothetical protein GM3709_3248 [Geminocystis sp. NIES-3709]